VTPLERKHDQLAFWLPMMMLPGGFGYLAGDAGLPVGWIVFALAALAFAFLLVALLVVKYRLWREA
jgi:hypothetical protein